MKKILLICILLASLTTISADNLQLFQAGKKAFSVGLYSIAIENFKQYIDENGFEKVVEAYYLSGVSSYYLKKYTDSRLLFKEIEDNYHESLYRIRSYYWIGLSFYYEENYENSIDYLNRGIEDSSPYNDVSYLFIALSNLKIGDYIAAEESFSKVINNPMSKPQFIDEALYRLGTLYLEQDKLNSAINILNRIVYNYPQSKYYIDALTVLADTYFVLGEWSNADTTYSLLLEYSDNYKVLYKRIANVKWKLNEVEECKKYLLLYKNNYEPDLLVLNMLGDIYSNEGQYKEAIAIYELVNSMPNLSLTDFNETNYRIGAIYYKNMDFKKAYNYLTKVDNLDATYFSIISGINSNFNVDQLVRKINLKYKDSELAKDSANRYINYLESANNKTLLEPFYLFITDLYPSDISYSKSYGEYLLIQKRWDDSIRYLSVGYNPESNEFGNLSYKIGWIYYNKGEYTRAIRFLSKVSPKDSDYDKALYSISIINYKLENYEEGAAGFIKLLEMKTSYKEEVSYYLGLIEKSRFNYTKAIYYFNTSKLKPSLTNDSLDSIAWCYYHLEEYEEALTIYTALGNNFNIANCYLYLNDYENALESYLKVANSISDETSSAYYKAIELSFKLNKDEDVIPLIKEFKSKFNNNLPGEVLLSEADNRLYTNNYVGAKELYLLAQDLYPSGSIHNRGSIRLADCYAGLGNLNEATDIYIFLIAKVSDFKDESLEKITDLMRNSIDIDFVKNVLDKALGTIKNSEDLVPIYIEFINQNIEDNGVIKIINDQLSIATKSYEIQRLLYLKALYFYNSQDEVQFNDNLNPLLSREDIDSDVKIDSIMLKARKLNELGNGSEAIDLYLNLYLNYSENKEVSSKALYNAKKIAEKLSMDEMIGKITTIITNEYKDTYWGRLSVNEE